MFLDNLLLIPVGQGPASTELSKPRKPKEPGWGISVRKVGLGAHRFITPLHTIRPTVVPA